MFLKDRRALVTGSTSGIGLAIARALRTEGAEVVLSGLGDQAAAGGTPQSTADECGHFTGQT